MSQPLVSEVYQPPAPNTLQDEPFEGHYQNWGYSIGYEVDASGKSVPENGNTTVFRIHPHGMTEPVFVTKPEEASTFTVRVLSGQGELIRARTDGEVEQLDLLEGSETVIRPGEAYIYRNTGKEDLVLHDVALPAFKSGDDVELTASYRATKPPEPKEGYQSCLAVTPDSDFVKVDLPEAFYNLVGQALRGSPSSAGETAEHDDDIAFSLGMTAVGLAMLGTGGYANYSAITGKHNGFDLLSWPSGLASMGAAITYVGAKGAIVGIRQRLARRSKS